MSSQFASIIPTLLALGLAVGLITTAKAFSAKATGVNNTNGLVSGPHSGSHSPASATGAGVENWHKQILSWFNTTKYGLCKNIIWLRPWQVPTAAAVAVITLFTTGWFPVAIASAAFVVTGPALVVTSAQQANFAQRTEAIATWSEALRDTMQASRGVEAAIRITAETAAKPIRNELLRMNRRIAMGMNLSEALAECADEIANPVFDLISAVLLNGIAISPAQVPTLLDSIAEQAREQAYSHLQVHTSRAKQRTQLRLVGIIVLLSSIGFIVAFGSYLEPLATPAGQLFLCLVAVSVAALLIWIVNLSTMNKIERVIDPRRALTYQKALISQRNLVSHVDLDYQRRSR